MNVEAVDSAAIRLKASHEALGTVETATLTNRILDINTLFSFTWVVFFGSYLSSDTYYSIYMGSGMGLSSYGRLSLFAG